MLYDILSHYTTTLLLRNCICPFSPTSQFFNSGHMTVFHSSMCIYLCHVNLAILVVIQLFRLVSSCPYRKNGYFVYSNSEGSWQHFLWVFRCLGPFQIFIFKTDILPTCDIFDHLKDRLVSQARQFPFPWQCWLHIEYEYWNRLAHWNRKGPACGTKPTFYIQKQKLPSSNKHELMVQRLMQLNNWCPHSLGGKNCLWNNGFYNYGLTAQRIPFTFECQVMVIVGPCPLL